MPYHILPGFRVRRAKNGRQNHWLGGSPLHKNAVCPVCNRLLLLLWDIDCGDTRFRNQEKSIFKTLNRLPLYYCWTCASEFDYQVLDSDQLRILSFKGEKQGHDFPYKNFPSQFDRQPIELDLLEKIPIAATRALQADSFQKLRKPAKLALEKWLGRSVRHDYDIWWHQFGGRPWLIQGKEKRVCANKRCSWSRRKWSMKILASIVNDPPGGLPMLETVEHVKKDKGFFNSWVQVVFHICPGCLSIHAANRCD
jgi:hypothetical protein